MDLIGDETAIDEHAQGGLADGRDNNAGGASSHARTH
jgi:hypothetical protein